MLANKKKGTKSILNKYNISRREKKKKAEIYGSLSVNPFVSLCLRPLCKTASASLPLGFFRRWQDLTEAKPFVLSFRVLGTMVIVLIGVLVSLR
jgi:hypothetical protein